MILKTKTRERILEAASDLFHAQGVHATGLDQILKKARAGKGQFYHYFRSKDDLLHHVMRQFFARLKSGEIPVKQELRTWGDLEDWFRFFVEAQREMRCERSCPIGTIGAELGDRQDALRRDACEIFDYARTTLVRFFALMRRKGNLPRSCDPETLADFCYTIMQGGLLVAKIRRDSTPFENAVNHALDHVRSLRS